MKNVGRKKIADKAGKIRDILLLSIVALILLVAVRKIFYEGDDFSSTAGVSATEANENERRLSELLSTMDGVGNVNVMICENEEGVKSVVVICEGANDLLVNMQVREAVAAALGTEEKSIKIYPMR